MRTSHQGEWLKSQIALAGMSKAAFAKRVGVTRDTVMRWMREPELSARPELLVSLMKALGWDVESLMSDGTRGRLAMPGVTTQADPLVVIAFRKELWARVGSPIFAHYRVSTGAAREAARGPRDVPVGVDSNVDPYSVSRLVAEVPVFDLSVAAGGWSDVSGQIEVHDDAQINQGLFRVRIRGDSMQPVFPDGSIVEFRIVRRGREGWPIGKNCYVQLARGDATFKHLDSVDEEKVRLSALNKKKYKKSLVAATSEVVSMAVAVGIFTPVGV